MINYASLIEFMKGNEAFVRWAECLEGQIEIGLSKQRHGDLPLWQSLVNSLPEFKSTSIDLGTNKVRVGEKGDVDDTGREALKKTVHAVTTLAKRTL